MGRSILNSTFLSTASTRRWLKPRAFTADLTYSVGAPWEIRRVDIGSRYIDMYTKEGIWGLYTSYIVLVQDFNVGFAVLAAASERPRPQAATYAIEKMIEKIFLPALEDVAREQAKASFSGRYTTNMENSSITIIVDKKPGLKISEWISDGVDLLGEMRDQLSSYNFRQTDPDWRLYPNLLYPAGGRTIGFAASSRWAAGPFPAWETIDGVVYGSIGIDNFVIEMDENGEKAVSVEPLAYRIQLQRAQD